MRFGQSTTYFCVLILSLINSNAHSGEFVVSPMLIEIHMSPGEAREFLFQVHGKQPGTAAIYFSDMKQQSSGHMAFLPFDEEQPGIEQWLSIDKSQLKLKQGETQTVLGRIKLPSRFKGNHVFAVMVEDAQNKEDRGISLNVRYAVVVSVTTPVKRKRLQSTFSDLSIEEQDGKYFVAAWFENLSDREAYFESIAYIRNSKNGLVAKVPLLTRSSWQQQSNRSRVFPQARVQVFGPLPDSVAGGAYRLSAKNRFGGKTMATTRQNVTLIKPEIIESGITSRQIVRVSPNPIPVSISSRGSSFTTLRIINELNESISIQLPVAGKNQGVSFRFSPDTVNLSANATRAVTLRQTFDGDPRPTSYKAKVIHENNEVEWLEIKTTI